MTVARSKNGALELGSGAESNVVWLSPFVVWRRLAGFGGALE